LLSQSPSGFDAEKADQKRTKSLMISENIRGEEKNGRLWIDTMGVASEENSD
jgi:hypothetical protein